MKHTDFSELIEFIEHNLTNEMSLEDISQFSYYSLPHIHRSLKSIMEYTLKEYVRKRRLSEAAVDLVKTNHSIIDIAFKYQYNSNEAFTRAFKSMFGCSPKVYRVKGEVVDTVNKYRIKGGRNLKLLNKIDSIYQKYHENPAGFNLKKELAKYTEEVLLEVKDCQYSKESVNFATKVLFRIGEYKEIKDLFETYLETVENLDDENWARYNLMMIKYNLNDEFFNGFKDYYNWMKNHIDKEQWYLAVCNSSILLHFIDSNKGDEYFKVVKEIRENAPSTIENRQARFETVRAMVLSNLRFKNYELVKKELEIFDEISSEDKSDINYLFNRSEYLIRKIYYLNAVKNNYSNEVEELMNHISSWKLNIDRLVKEYNKEFNKEYFFRSYDELRYDKNPLKSLRSVIHNVGCMFYFLGEYQKSLDMFDDPICNNYLNSYSAGLYMGSVYALTKDVKKLLEAMSLQKRVLENSPDYWKSVKELEHLKDNLDFINELEKL